MYLNLLALLLVAAAHGLSLSPGIGMVSKSTGEKVRIAALPWILLLALDGGVLSGSVHYK